MITRTFKLCLNAGTGSAPFINVSQTDRDEVWLFELYSETGERYIPSSGAIIGIKADGHGISNTGTVDNEGRVVITETEQMTAAAGRAIFELSIDGLTHGTANFIVNVEKKPIDGAIMSDSDLSLISEAVDSAAVIVEVIGDSDPSEVIGEHVDDWLDAHPEATTTVQDGAITAPKINNSLWDKILVNEEASGAVASFDDGADDVPVSSLKVNLEPIQTGTGDPSPTNIRPIYPANGRNMYDKTAKDTTNGYVADKYLTNTGSEASSTGNQISEYIAVMPDTDYTLHPTAGNNLSYGFYDSTKTWLSGAKYSGATVVTAHSPVNASYMRASVPVGNEDTFMIELGSSASAFRPYQGIMVERCGKNMMPTSTYTGGTRTTLRDTLAVELTNILKDKQGAFTISGVSAHTSTNSYLLTLIINYTDSTSETTTMYRGESAGAIVGHFSATTNPSKIIDNVYVGGNSASATCDLSEMMCEVGSEATAYEPYTSTSYPYTLGQSVYGGTVDLATGVLTVDTVSKTISSVSGWANRISNQNRVYATAVGVFGSTDVPYTYTSEAEMIADGRNLCDKMLVRNTSSSATTPTFTVGLSTYIYLNGVTHIDGVTDMESLETWINDNPLQITYRLATPQTIQLTPQEVKTLLGYNNISSSGTVDVIYHADTKLYVDKMTNVDNSVIAPTEETFTATRNYTVNDLVIVADTLYKVTANIASGSAITPNSNVQQTTLSALIKALS